MAAGPEGVFLVEEDVLVGLDLKTGKELWRVPRPPRPAEKVTDAYRNDHTNLCTLVYDGVVYDHIWYRPRGGWARYEFGKNRWKFESHFSTVEGTIGKSKLADNWTLGN